MGNGGFGAGTANTASIEKNIEQNGSICVNAAVERRAVVVKTVHAVVAKAAVLGALGPHQTTRMAQRA
eukprot:CAMPEP_0171814070 /NCGR_PEP_ID=MMETSP0991-20121206/79547_1 /TAXON_ID=483369 /ORGANISM="non described non described, Strain CCMP2098" /LENGTH=67 /DNA_ID=CAMNT_0012427683 /DNA_START=565 /DNA_END=765 /DNA_ORIENTATION=-